MVGVDINTVKTNFLFKLSLQGNKEKLLIDSLLLIDSFSLFPESILKNQN